MLIAGLAACTSDELDHAVDAATINQPDSRRCRAPAGTTASPRSVADVLSLLDALPQPVSIACFLETLDRPLALYATISSLSAQPAAGRRSPRLFLFFDGLTLSVVPAGVGSQLLEFGEARPDSRSLKAEIQFPVAAKLSAAAPFERVTYSESLSNCGLCHRNETVDDTIPFTRAYVSQAMRPPPRDRVPLAELAAENSSCDSTDEPERCAMLASIFAQAEPVDHEFPAAYSLFVE